MPAMVHDEIWNALYHAGLLIFDVTDDNPSVMMELGVASAWRERAQVLVIQNADRKSNVPFNLMPARIIRYTSDDRGLAQLRRQATSAFIWSLSTLPVTQLTRHPQPPVFPFRYPENSELLLTPALSHRYQRPDGALVFGAPHVFQQSFALPHTGPRTRMRLNAKMSFAERQPTPPDPPWIGLKLLGSGVLMNHGVGVVLRENGRVQITYQESEAGPYHDPTVGALDGFDADKDTVDVFACVDDETFSICLLSKDREVKYGINLVSAAHYRPSEGVCLFQAFRCRAVLHGLCVE